MLVYCFVLPMSCGLLTLVLGIELWFSFLRFLGLWVSDFWVLRLMRFSVVWLLLLFGLVGDAVVCG